MLRLRARWWITVWWIAWLPRRRPWPVAVLAITVPVVAGSVLAAVFVPVPRCGWSPATGAVRPHLTCAIVRQHP